MQIRNYFLFSFVCFFALAYASCASAEGCALDNMEYLGMDSSQVFKLLATRHCGIDQPSKIHFSYYWDSRGGPRHGPVAAWCSKRVTQAPGFFRYDCENNYGGLFTSSVIKGIPDNTGVKQESQTSCNKVCNELWSFDKQRPCEVIREDLDAPGWGGLGVSRTQECITSATFCSRDLHAAGDELKMGSEWSCFISPVLKGLE